MSALAGFADADAVGRTKLVPAKAATKRARHFAHAPYPRRVVTRAAASVKSRKLCFTRLSVIAL